MAADHVQSVWAVVPGGIADGRPEDPRSYVPGKEPAKNTDLARTFPAEGLSR